MITVTLEDINTAELNDFKRTPVAIALSRISGYKVIELNGSVYIDELSFSAKLPIVVQFFEDCFQKGEKISPFSFEVQFKDLVPF